MIAASKRAEAFAPTPMNTALQGGQSNIIRRSIQMTVTTNITPAPGAATHTVMVAEDRSRPLNPGEPMKFSTTLDGQPVVTRSTTPFFDTCRVLSTWGMTGKVAFVDAITGAPRMTMLITAGAKLTIEDGPAGPRTRKYRGADVGEAMKGGQSAAQPAYMAEEV